SIRSGSHRACVLLRCVKTAQVREFAARGIVTNELAIWVGGSIQPAVGTESHRPNVGLRGARPSEIRDGALRGVHAHEVSAWRRAQLNVSIRTGCHPPGAVLPGKRAMHHDGVARTGIDGQHAESSAGTLIEKGCVKPLASRGGSWSDRIVCLQPDGGASANE